MDELEDLAAQAGQALQDIQNAIGDRTHVPEAVVRFPRGYVRPTSSLYAELPAIGDHTKRRNLAYQLMRTDVCSWLLSRTDIYGQVRSVVIGEYISILGYGAEFFVKALTHGKVGRQRPFGRHTARLETDGVIDAALKAEVDWLWHVRTHEHLDATTDLRHCAHSAADMRRAEKAWAALLSALDDHLSTCF